MRTQTSAAAVLQKTSAPTKTNPNNRLRTIPLSPFSSIHRYTHCCPKRFSAPQPGVWGERVGRTGHPSFKQVEGHLARRIAPCTLERGCTPTDTVTDPRPGIF